MVYLVTDQAELLPSGELPGAGVAGEAGEVEDLVVGSPDPVGLGDGVATLGALGPVQPHVVNLAEDLVVLQETRGVAVQGVLTHRAPQTLRVPAFVSNLVRRIITHCSLSTFRGGTNYKP